MKAQRFEDLIAWQKARVLTREVYEMTRRTPFSRDFGLSGQIQRASVSVMSNLAEGFERGRASEFHQFASTAKASVAEVRSQLYVAYDVQYIDDAQFEHLYTSANEIGRIIGGLRAALDRKRIKPR